MEFILQSVRILHPSYSVKSVQWAALSLIGRLCFGSMFIKVCDRKNNIYSGMISAFCKIEVPCYSKIMSNVFFSKSRGKLLSSDHYNAQGLIFVLWMSGVRYSEEISTSRFDMIHDT